MLLQSQQIEELVYLKSSEHFIFLICLLVREGLATRNIFTSTNFLLFVERGCVCAAQPPAILLKR
jgi:hypothetical protein